MFLKDVNKEKILRDGEFEVLGIIDSLTSLPMLTFLDNEKYLDHLLMKKTITCVYTTQAIGERLLEKSNLGIMISENPRIEFFELHNYLKDNEVYVRKKFESKVGQNTCISKQAVISNKNVRIGDNVLIEPFVMIYPNVEIGDNTIIRSGAKIGGSGFEFKRTDDAIFAVEHLGGVKIGAHVEIQNNTCIDRAVYPWDDTVIGDFTKIDNLVHIGHAAKIDEDVMIVANSGIGGRTEIKKGAWIGFGATLRNGLVVERESRANIGAVVTKGIAEGQAVTGNFAIDHSKFMENLKNITK